MSVLYVWKNELNDIIFVFQILRSHLKTLFRTLRVPNICTSGVSLDVTNKFMMRTKTKFNKDLIY
jgi:hypothetical protein